MEFTAAFDRPNDNGIGHRGVYLSYDEVSSVVRHSESLALAYFVYLGVAAAVRRLPPSRRASLVGIAALFGVLIVILARVADARTRDWAPLLYVLAGYYASGLLFVHPSGRFEAWLMDWDHRWLGDPTTRFARWPRWLVAYLDLVYLGCFLLLPAGFAVFEWRGHAALADRYWTMVLGAELGAFAPLALVETRPPWAVERRPVLADRSVHGLASQLVEHLTIGVNTFPSGHVAGSLAVAFAVLGVVPWVGLLLLVLAISIAVACVVGRYHYVIDVIAGAALAIGVWAAVVALHV